jgi:hypothetical protein
VASPGKVRLRLVMFAAVGTIAAILLGMVWSRNTSRAWGEGPGELTRQATALCDVFGITLVGPADQRIIIGDQGTFWVTQWAWADTTVSVVQEPAGALARFTMTPTPKIVSSLDTHSRSWVETISADLDSLLGDFKLGATDETASHLTSTLMSERGETFRLSFPLGPSTGPLELARENPPSVTARWIPYPTYLLTLVLTVLMIALSLRVVWKPVVEARANPAGVVVWACIAGVAAFFFSLWELLREMSMVSASLATSLAFAAGAAALVMVGTYVTNSQPPERRVTPPLGDALLSGWLLGFVGVGVASAGYLLPAAAQSTADRFVGSGLVSFQALLLAVAAAIALERGIRPLTTVVVGNTRPVQADLALAAIGSLWVPYSASTGWLWSRVVMFVALYLSGRVNRRYGSWAACITAAMFFVSWSLLPGLALPGSRLVLAALVGGIGLIAGPVLLYRLLSKQPLKQETWPPEYVKSICSKASVDHVDTLAEALQPSPLQGFDGEYDDQDEAVIFRRGRPAAADICRVTRLGKSKLSVLFTEVPGRGIRGAFQAAVVSTAIDALAKEPKRPADLLLRLHSVICSAWVGEGGPTSIVYGVLDRRSNSFTFAGLGNHQVLLRRALVGRFERLAPSSGPFDPLSPVEVDAMLDAQSVQLISRDLLVLFTDGLVNATSPIGEKFGIDRLEKLIREQKTATCKELATALEQQLDSFLGGSPPADDIIVLFLRGSH